MDSMSRLVLCQLWMRNKYKIAVAVCLVLLMVALPGAFAGVLAPQATMAQKQGVWSPPFRLSTEKGKASEAYLVADQYGYAHVFWTEALADERSIIQYARFDGQTWSTPVDIYVSRPSTPIGNVSPVVDRHGTLHIAWVEGLNGPAYYSSAPARDALSAQHWERPYRLNIPASTVKLQVDSKDVLHILCTRSLEQEPGVYYVSSADHGLNWSGPRWLDPDILPGYVPRNLNFVLDESDGLHAAWYYTSLSSASGDWVRYTHSLDGGANWSLPTTIDRDEKQEGVLGNAGTIMAVQGRTVHIIWAVGNNFLYRYHRYSSDAGNTWSEPRRVFGNLNGGAGDGLAVDSLGRVHYFGQIRFPQAIYHAYWDESQWTTPEVVYLIRNSGDDSLGDHIHAHATYPIVRAGNQLVLSFADPPPEPGRRLFVMVRTLADVAPLEPVATPTLPATPVLQSSPTPSPTATPSPPSFDQAAPISLTGTPTPDRTIWLGLVPALLLIGAAIMTRLLLKSRH